MSAIATGALSAVLAGATFTKWLGAQVPNVEAVLGSGTIVIAAAPQVVPTTTTAASTTSTTSPPPTTSPTVPTAPNFASGSSFNDDCVIAWPTAPSYTSTSIEMTMTCEHVPEGQYLFTDVIHDDPSRSQPPTADHDVVGRVVDEFALMTATQNSKFKRASYDPRELRPAGCRKDKGFRLAQTD